MLSAVHAPNHCHVKECRSGCIGFSAKDVQYDTSDAISIPWRSKAYHRIPIYISHRIIDRRTDPGIMTGGENVKVVYISRGHNWEI
ncbi:MAG: hypothetical protein RBG13Loki_0920 [Promethearchaeota archaeon CR_4]|nr:MAG: hypothetical protein RBG13Loki_0920 [Candidatus Lokiarchaeota archaeon CR_4]